MVLLPLSALVLSSFFAEPGVLRWSNLSLRAWKYVLFSLDEFKVALLNSFLTAGAAALLVMALALVLSIAGWQGHYQHHRLPGRLARISEHGAMFCYSLPGTVLALSLIILLGRLPIMDTLLILIVAFTIKSPPSACRPCDPRRSWSTRP